MEVRLRPMPHRADNIFKIQYSIGWSDPDPALERNYLNQTRVTHDFMTTFVSKNPSGVFLNYRDLDIGVMTRDNYSEGKVYGQYHQFSRMKIIHRDLKASNILLDDYLKPKISGFKLFRMDESNPEHSCDCVGVWARAYMRDPIQSMPIIRVTIVLGSTSATPPLSVKLKQVFTSGSQDTSIINQLRFYPKEEVHTLDAFPVGVDVGKYIFAFEPEHKKIYATVGRIKVPVYVTGVIKIDNAKIEVLESDSVETENKYLTTPLQKPFNPHQALLKSRHEFGVEHIFVVGISRVHFKDFLGLVEKLFYLSGKYDIELTVADAVMENSFSQALGHIDLDLPEVPEKATHPPAQAVDPYSRFGPMPEICNARRSGLVNLKTISVKKMSF
ncbi:hypothetical protein Lser_V15G25035 [Lactuca serriola]